MLQLTDWETRSMSRASCDFVSLLKFPFFFFFWPTLLKRFSSKWQKADIFDLRIAQGSKRNFAEDHDA